MNRIDQKFADLRAAGQKAFVAYITAGDPDLESTARYVRALEKVGVDVVELGVPFSDPLADGVVNQRAAERALRSGTTPHGVLATVRRVRDAGCRVPVVLYIYFNLIHRHGVKSFGREAARAGVDGVLALDLPPEEAGPYETAMRQAGVHPIFLIAPTTPEPRIAEIAGHGAGFLYYISREGVTGMQREVADRLAERVAVIRRCSRVPVVVGFGVATPEHAATVARAADGVVVGSAIVDQMARHGRHVARVMRFVSRLVRAVKKVRAQ
ncbi:MAG: tryptophan synthase subunit alpha [Verrucomicrobiae bacterium]|nr:tryptophan synthase subunit alpha [Verrucomicrobiae bacterium]